jgi:hypothetical protein
MKWTTSEDEKNYNFLTFVMKRKNVTKHQNKGVEFTFRWMNYLFLIESGYQAFARLGEFF